MRVISSDTNVWIDFATINRLALPFKLPYIYLMDVDAISNELLQPEGLAENLSALGLKPTELTEEEFFLAEELTQKYRKPSTYDCIALAIAKCRDITLLTGDRALRKAAIAEGVDVIGSIGMMDILLEQKLIDASEYVFCMKEFKRLNGGKIRLPEDALLERIERFK